MENHEGSLPYISFFGSFPCYLYYGMYSFDNTCRISIPTPRYSSIISSRRNILYKLKIPDIWQRIHLLSHPPTAYIRISVINLTPSGVERRSPTKNSLGPVGTPQNSSKGVVITELPVIVLVPLASIHVNSSFVSSRFRPAVSGRNSNVHKRPRNVRAEKNQNVPFG